jgi:hypothetical protein
MYHGNKDKAFGSSPEKGIFVISHLSANHEEGDTVWFHAFKSTANRLIIYSPDTDTFFIGLPLIKKLTGKSIFVQLKTFSSFSHEILTVLILKTSQKENSPDFFSVLCQIENVSSLSLVNQSCQKLHCRYSNHCTRRHLSRFYQTPKMKIHVLL